MTYSSYRVKVPGKLLIAGEYAVLEPNQQAIVIAVNRYLTAKIEPSVRNELSLPQLGLNHVTWKIADQDIQFNVSDPRLQFIRNSIAVVNQFLQEKSVSLRPIYLSVKSDLDDADTGQKYGLGSSAAIVVAVISAMLSLYNEGKEQATLEEIFKLAVIAHLKTQKNGSGADIAAAVFGGWLVYSSFQPYWLVNKLQQGIKLNMLVEMPWPNLSITPLRAPSLLNLCVGWTGEAASTGPLVKKVQQFRKGNLKVYNEFLKENSIAVNQLIQSIKVDDYWGASSSLAESRKALKKLSEDASITIETAKLKELSEIANNYGSGKSAGAGGGDCGIAFVKEESHIPELYKAWQNAGIMPLNIAVSKNGVTVTEYTCEMSLNEYLASCV